MRQKGQIFASPTIHTQTIGACIDKSNHRHRTRNLVWTTSTQSPDHLKQKGFIVIEYHRIKKRILSSQTTTTTRSTLTNPAEKILKLFQRNERIAILGVQCQSNEDLTTIYGYLVEPAFRSGCTLLISANQSLLQIARTPAPQWRYPWTLERLQNLMDRGRHPCQITMPAPVNRWHRFWKKLSLGIDGSSAPPITTHLDPQQNAAINAGDGVVQIIAPAGSGKTTVLIERVKELKRRGTPAEKILCMSFNRDAKVEIGQRLVNEGIDGVIVRSFHGMGLAILKAENRLRKNIGSVTDLQMEQIISQAATHEYKSTGNPMTVPEARRAISNFKLAAMIPPREALRLANNAHPKERIAARIFDLYEKELAHRHLLDFDDLVAKAVTLLQTNQAARRRWQQKFQRVLVDEYQDIEPSQALLVGILAAPQDSLFCVGDEDQCIYAWRRATVQRIIELDQVYPGLERHALIRNYRCGKRITKASRKLIEHNRIRFNKPLLAGVKEQGEIVAASFPTRAAGAAIAARLIHSADPENVVVLARTSRLLEEVKNACIRLSDTETSVELATIHAAKGRQWDRVILFAVDEGQTPHARAKDEKSIEDERRLFYVAMTRAKNRLEIISTRGRESRFLREAGLR